MIKKIRSKLESDKNLKEILSGSAITFALKMGGLLLSYIVILLISKRYGAEGVGIYSLTVSVIVFVSMLSTMGMTVSILRYVGQFNKEGNKKKLRLLYKYVIQITLSLSIVLSILLFFLAETVSLHLFNNNEYKHALEVAAFIIPFFSLINVNVEYIRGLKHLRVSEFLRSVNSPAINVVLLLVAGLYVVDPLLPLYTLATATFVASFVSIYFIVGRLPKPYKSSHDSFTRKELIFTSSPMLLTLLSVFVTGNISLLFLQMFTNASQVGIFSVAMKVALLISLVLLVVNTIVAPKVSELFWKKEYENLQKMIDQSTKVILFVSLALGLIVALLNEKILGFFGDDFVTGSSALYFLIIGQLANAATGSVGVFFNMTGNQKVLRNITVVTMLLSIGLSYMLIPIYGINGAAFVSMTTAILANVTSAFYIKSQLGYTTYFVPSFLKVIK